MNKYDLTSLALRNVSADYMMISEKCYIPLFHGTDLNVVNLSEEIRCQRRHASLSLINYAYPILKDKIYGKMKWHDENSVFGEYHQAVMDAYVCAGSIELRTTTFEYDNCYLTPDPDKAFRYASRSHIYGELGYIAYNLCLGLMALGCDVSTMNNDQRNAFEIIEAAHDKAPNPVVYMYLGIPKAKIKKENGEDVDWTRTIGAFLDGCYLGSYRVLNPFDITKGKIIDIDSIPRIEDN